MATPLAWVIEKVDRLKSYSGDVPFTADFRYGGVIINEQFIIAKRKTRFRPLGQLDWAHYTPKGLGAAIAENTVLEYYEYMLTDSRSPKSEWKGESAMSKKAYYAERNGMASLISDD